MKLSGGKRSGVVSGHCLATLGEVTETAVTNAAPDRKFVYLDIGSIDRESKSFRILKEIEPREAPTRARQYVKQGDVLVSMTRPGLNAVAMVPTQDHFFVASTGFHVLRPNRIESKYLFYLVQTDQFIESMSAQVQGALYPAVRPKDIEGFQFRLPPHPEQVRIIEKLEELLSELDAGVNELKAAQRKLVQYRQSLLKAAVEGTLTADWRAARAQSGEPQETGAELLQRILTERRTRWEAKQLAKFAKQGKAPPNGWRIKYLEPIAPNVDNLPALPDGWTWASVDQLSPDDLANGRSVPSSISGAKVLRLTSVKEGKIDLSEFKHGNWSDDEARQFLVAEGDLLIIRGNGSLSLVGRAGIVNSVTEQVAYPDTMIRLRVVDSVVRSRWVAALWDSSLVRSHMESRARTSAGIYKISQPDIISVIVPIPPISEQDKILTVLDRSADDFQALQRSLVIAERQSSAQRKNILKAAFSGELVSQDQNDEPASVLLERIRAERIGAGSKRTGNTMRRTKERA